MSRRIFKSSALSLFIAAGFVCIMSLGGCPVAQTPQTPDSSGDDNQQQQTPTTNNNGQDLERPITQPNLETPENNDDQVGKEQTAGGDNTGGGSSSSDTGVVMLAIGQPSDDMAIPAPPRGSATVSLEFTLVDTAGKVANGALLLARDDDDDGVPDGDPIYTAPLAIRAGSNVWLFDTSNIAQHNMLQNQGVGKFVIGVKAVTGAGDETIAFSSATITVDNDEPTVNWQGHGENDQTINLEDRLINRDTPWTVNLMTEDTSEHSWRIFLDPDLTPMNGNEYELFPNKTEAAGQAVRKPETPASLSAYPAGTYYYYYVATDGIEPAVAGYAPGDAPASQARLAITRRLISTADNPFEISQVAEREVGATLQGHNYRDLAGSSMASVPDINGDGYDELVIVSRFGKPSLQSVNGVGWGEAYLVLGQATRLTGETRVNAVGDLDNDTMRGLVFTGIRCPVTTSWTEGISDVTAVPDMDADGLPEIVFSFPRVESVSLGNSANYWQLEDYSPYNWMGSLEYDPASDVVDTLDITDPDAPGFPFSRSSLEVDVNGHTWLKNRTQFTRGGIVVVSSGSSMLQNENQLNHKGNRVLDLHETGQMFSNMHREDEHVPFIEDIDAVLQLTDCDNPPDGEDETEYETATVYWDVLQTDCGPVGFDNWVTNRKFMDPMNPPIANMWASGAQMWDINSRYLPQDNSPCEENCVITNSWLDYTPCNWYNTGTASLVYKNGLTANPSTETGFYIYTSFYGAGVDPEVSPWAENVGARVLGQRVNDRFGSSISSDGTWLYMSAPNHSVDSEDVPSLGDDVVRNESGVIYQYRTYSPASVGGPTRSQLWIENGYRTVLDPNDPDADPTDPNSYVDVRAAWPHPDIDRPGHTDYNMPCPHTYIIEDLGYTRTSDLFWRNELENLGYEVPDEDEGELRIRSLVYSLLLNVPSNSCVANALLRQSVEGGVRPGSCESTDPPGTATVGTAHWYMSHTKQIVGPHDGAKLSFVRAIGDIDGDSIEDFAVGSENVKSNVLNPNDPGATEVGGIFIVFGRPPQLEGDYLLENLAKDPSDLSRLAGVFVKGASTNEKLARTFDKAGNFNDSQGEDVLVGNEGGGAGAGAAIVLLGSINLNSPANGWTTTAAVNAGVAVRFVGENVGDRAGANVAYAGDVDGDGLGDILIAAPGADGGKGAVYLIYGSDTFIGGESYSLADIGTVDLPGIKFIGKNAGDALGGGVLTFGDGDGANPYGNVALNPDGDSVKVYSDGIVSIGDLDGDGRDDIAISSMLADPVGRIDSGEVYVIYGAGD